MSIHTSKASFYCRSCDDVSQCLQAAKEHEPTDQSPYEGAILEVLDLPHLEFVWLLQTHAKILHHSEKTATPSVHELKAVTDIKGDHLMPDDGSLDALERSILNDPTRAIVWGVFVGSEKMKTEFKVMSEHKQVVCVFFDHICSAC